MKDIPSLEEENLTRLRQLTLTLNGSELKGGLLSAFIASHFRREGILGDLSRFLADWQSPSATVPVQTSGSTGAPKPMQAEKRRMAQSARRTCASSDSGREIPLSLLCPSGTSPARWSWCAPSSRGSTW